MTRVLHLPRGARGVDHWSGASYRADGNGHVTVPSDVADDFRRNGVLRHYDVTLIGTAFGSSAEGVCGTCNFSPWPWQAAEGLCPRCGAAIPAVIPEESECSTDAATSTR
jgi:hypothetical protein